MYSAAERARLMGSLTEMIGVLAKPLLVHLIIALVGIPTRYELHATELVVRSGILRYRVSYQNVRGISPSHNPLSAPAWSLDRLRIDKVGGGYLLVSPKDKRGFLCAVANRAPQLIFEGGKLRLREGGVIGE